MTEVLEELELDRWENVFGYVMTEYDIDTNSSRVVFHLEKDGYFTGYYMEPVILTDKCIEDYRFIMRQMVYDLENPREH